MSSPGPIVRLLVLDRAGVVQSEDDRQADADAGHVGAEQVAEHQPLRVLGISSITRHRSEQGRVGHREQCQAEDVEQVAHATTRTEAALTRQRSQRPRRTTSWSVTSKLISSESLAIARSSEESSKGTMRPQRRQIA